MRSISWPSSSGRPAAMTDTPPPARRPPRNAAPASPPATMDAASVRESPAMAAVHGSGQDQLLRRSPASRRRLHAPLTAPTALDNSGSDIRAPGPIRSHHSCEERPTSRSQLRATVHRTGAVAPDLPKARKSTENHRIFSCFFGCHKCGSSCCDQTTRHSPASPHFNANDTKIIGIGRHIIAALQHKQKPNDGPLRRPHRRKSRQFTLFYGIFTRFAPSCSAPLDSCRSGMAGQRRIGSVID